jgi:hypothetical protein
VPELPEVETTRRRLLPLLEGKRLLEVRHQDPLRYRHTERAREQAVEGVGRRGKFLLFELSGGLEMVVHLGMTGGFRLEKTPHTRAEFLLEDGVLHFHDPRRFGRIWVVERGAYGEIPLLARLGPEPLSPEFRPEAFLLGLRRSRKPLKALLLDQTLAAGGGQHLRRRGPLPGGPKPLPPGVGGFGGGSFEALPGPPGGPGGGGGLGRQHPLRPHLPAARRPPGSLPNAARRLRAHGPPLPQVRRPHRQRGSGGAGDPLLPPGASAKGPHFGFATWGAQVGAKGFSGAPHRGFCRGGALSRSAPAPGPGGRRGGRRGGPGGRPGPGPPGKGLLRAAPAFRRWPGSG